MKRLLIILIPVAASLIFGIYTTRSLQKQNEAFQIRIALLLAQETPDPDALLSLSEDCDALVNGIGMVLNDDRTADVALQAQKLRFAALQQEQLQIKETLFTLSTALEALAAAEQVSIQALL